MYILIVLLAVLFSGLSWFVYWNSHAKKFNQSGYTPPSSGRLAKVAFGLCSRLYTFLTVGPVKVIGAENSPRSGRTIWAANHQVPADFAMLRRGSNRHFRMLTDAGQLTGFFAVVSAWMGVISVDTREKGGGAAAEKACTKVVSLPNGSLGIFPQGSLLPDNALHADEFRPGAVRMAQNAFAETGEDVQIVPMAIHYKRDPLTAHWSQRWLNKMRSGFYGMRNPKHWDPDFKINIEELPAAQREELQRIREEKLQAYRKSRVTLYGGVVVVGKAIKASELPSDQLAAIEVIRLRIAELLATAKQA